MEGYRYKVGAMPYAYHIAVDEDPNPKSPKHQYINHRGYEEAMLHIASKHMNFTYEFVNPVDLVWGGLIPINGATDQFEWDGTIRCLIEIDECDMAIGAMVIYHSRAQVVTHTYPFDTEAFTFATGLPRPLQTLDGILNPFSYVVWMLLLLTLPIQIIATYYIVRLERESDSEWFSLGNCCIYAIGALIGENVCTVWRQRGLAFRILLGTWIICSLVLTASFGGKLRAFLSKPVYEKAISSPEDILQSDVVWDMKIYGEDVEDDMATSDNPVIKAIWDGKQVADLVSTGYERVSTLVALKDTFFFTNKCNVAAKPNGQT